MNSETCLAYNNRGIYGSIKHKSGRFTEQNLFWGRALNDQQNVEASGVRRVTCGYNEMGPGSCSLVEMDTIKR